MSSISRHLAEDTIDTRLSVDCAKARSELGWTPKVSLDEGITKTLEWIRARKEG